MEDAHKNITGSSKKQLPVYPNRGELTSLTKIAKYYMI